MNLKQLENKWGFNMESSSTDTECFLRFVKDFKKSIKDACKYHRLQVVSISKGHFYISGFLKNLTTNKYIYFSVGDTRFGCCGEEWWERCLYREAENEKDYMGKRNNFCSLGDLIINCKDL